MGRTIRNLGTSGLECLSYNFATVHYNILAIPFQENIIKLYIICTQLLIEFIQKLSSITK
jgi:hypothetical protein